MALDVNDGDFGRGNGREVTRDGGDPHRECGFVCVHDCIGYAELCAGLPQSCSVLRRGVDRNVEDGGRLDQLLGGENAGF